jgi:hypothetical protein
MQKGEKKKGKIDPYPASARNVTRATREAPLDATWVSDHHTRTRCNDSATWTRGGCGSGAAGGTAAKRGIGGALWGGPAASIVIPPHVSTILKSIVNINQPGIMRWGEKSDSRRKRPFISISPPSPSPSLLSPPYSLSLPSLTYLLPKLVIDVSQRNDARSGRVSLAIDHHLASSDGPWVSNVIPHSSTTFI